MPPFAQSRCEVSIDVDRHYNTNDTLPSIKLPTSTIPKRAVSFNPLIRVADILNKEEYSHEERSATWYHGCEFGRIQQENLIAIRRYTRQSLLGVVHSNDCMRGLESSPKGQRRKRRQKVRFLSLHFVLREQYRQRLSGRNDPNRIGQLYYTVASRCRQEAIDAAGLDAEAADLYQDEPSEDVSHDDDLQVFNCWLFTPSSWFAAKSSPFVDSSSALAQ